MQMYLLFFVLSFTTAPCNIILHFQNFLLYLMTFLFHLFLATLLCVINCYLLIILFQTSVL
jgi:hypothetical protein